MRNKMKIPLVDLKAQYNSIKREINEATRRVIDSGQFILGPEVKSFEDAVAAYLGTKYAVGVASGTDALQLALLACGIKQGDEVITTPFTYIATAESIHKCGAKPVFADIEPETCNIDPKQVKLKITKNTRAILPVHLYGHPADMTPLLDLAAKYNLKLIEDCAQALGAKYNGQRVGSLGDAGSLSFFPSKVLGAYGDGGMVVTNSPAVAEAVTLLRAHGAKPKYHYLVTGYNSRLDSIQAAILAVKLKYLDSWNEQRRLKAELYSKLLRGIDGVEPPYEASYSYHIFNYYTIRLKRPGINRGKLIERLNNQGIATAVYYPLSLHLQEVYKDLGYKPGDFPVSEAAQEEVLSLPMYPELGEEQIKKITQSF
jgi:dTDP-4-amino-4,6-dideoxygalactose transaminase